ncbi:MAG: amylo-alpha-1,6-glucosidase [Chloroflexota bacterium]|nr:MAG: amylo-alpha-1,6-glucosidase [Chloroflexota bacterium]
MTDLLLSPRSFIIHHEDTILVTNRPGWVGEDRTGLFSRDTRYISSYRLTVNGFEPRFLGASRPYYFAATFYYTNPRIGTEPHLIPENSILLKISRHVREGVHEDIDLTNYAGKSVQLTLVLSVGADFADIFQVRGLQRIIPRMAEVRWEAASGTLSMHHRKGDFARTLRYQLHDCTSPPTHSLGSLTFRFELVQGQTWHACVSIHFDDKPAPVHDENHQLSAVTAEFHRWQETTASIESPTMHVVRTYTQAVLDLASLRLEEVDARWFPAAGLPWYTAVFGRDALVTALQTMTVYCPFGVGVLERLAELQGKKVDAWTEEEPGKIPHELRHGELTSTGKIPFSPYYGTVDASLLFVILLYEIYRFTADRGLLDRFYGPAAACLEWAARYGDIDGDSFVEYYPRTPQGYRNQGWKDSGDAVVYPDGSLVAPPIAICEVQGYYYDALRRMAHIARLCECAEDGTAYTLLAERLFERFNQTFWLENEGTYAFGLDPRKQPIATIASNPGHLLWSGIVPPERAGSVANRLLAEDMFSGWGIRTLSSDSPVYDPVSYQRGSVWPHDNGVIALGLKQYGLWREVNRIADGIFAAASCYEHHSLPEVFTGIARSPGNLPVPYLDTNLPQAWAAGSVFMLLRAILGLEPDPAHRRLVVAPTLPEWLPELELRNLTLFDGRLDLLFQGAGLASTVKILRRRGHVDVLRRRGDTVAQPAVHGT